MRTSPVIKHVQLFVLCLLSTEESQSQSARPPANPKTSQHASFKPEKYERLALIVKKAKQEPANVHSRFSAPQDDAQGEMERRIEQNFMRVLIGSGYTLVSRGDLDAAMREKGLDHANMTDAKRNEAVGKLLHVPCLMIVTVELFETSVVQQPAQQAAQHPAVSEPPSNFRRVRGRFRPSMNPGFSPAVEPPSATPPTFQVLASVSARLVKIDDNMVLWTGDFAVSRIIAVQEHDTIILGQVAEAIAKSVPPVTSSASGSKTFPTP